MHDPAGEIRESGPGTAELVRLEDIAGVGADGEVPPRLVEECRLALVEAAALLAVRGLSLHDVRQFTYQVRDTDSFSQCHGVLSEAFGPARPAVTMRIVQGFARADQRLAFGFVAAEEGRF